jgi:hypothetical protein
MGWLMLIENYMNDKLIDSCIYHLIIYICEIVNLDVTLLTKFYTYESDTKYGIRLQRNNTF